MVPVTAVSLVSQRMGWVYLLGAIVFGGSYIVKLMLTSTYRKWSRVPNQHGVTGAQTAAAILRSNGADHVKIQATQGKLTDHYDPQRDILRLSRANYAGTSVAAMAVSAHEAGHAIQDFTGDVRMRFRRFLVPLAAIGARFGPMVALGGLIFQSDTLIRWGVFLLAAMVVFQLATLPVEFNASRRARKNLERLGLSDPEQRDGVEKVLRAAALTYVAAAATTIAYFATIFLSGRSRGAV